MSLSQPIASEEDRTEMELMLCQARAACLELERRLGYASAPPSLPCSRIVQNAHYTRMLFQWAAHDSWRLLYRASRDGFGVRDFHARCDDHANTMPTLCICRTRDGSVFGAYTRIAWTGYRRYVPDATCFTFTLDHYDGQGPRCFRTTECDYAVYHSHVNGPAFGRTPAWAIESSSVAGADARMWCHTGPMHEFACASEGFRLCSEQDCLVDELEVYCANETHLIPTVMLLCQ